MIAEKKDRTSLSEENEQTRPDAVDAPGRAASGLCHGLPTADEQYAVENHAIEHLIIIESYRELTS